jgi:hypothetical protein
MQFVHRSLSILSLAVYATLASADPASTSSYFSDPQSSHVEDATSQGIGQVNMIACIMAAMRPEVLVNKGDYNALVDESKCEPSGSSGGSSSGAGGDAAQAATYMTATVNASRISNTAPMISKIWLVQEEEGHQTTIDVHVAATAPPTDANPYGSFRLDYCGKRADLANCRMNGYLEGSDTGIRYFETETRDDGNGIQTQTTALRLMATGTSTGSGRMQIDSSEGQGAFDFAYNAGLYRRSDGTEDQCFSRDANDADTGFSVWRYGLYDASSGARITRNSGFPIEYVNGGQTYQGYLGYYGLQLPAAALESLASGSTIQKANYGNSGQAPTKTDYAVVKADGKLLKFTRQTRTLHQIDKIKFNTFVGNEAADFFAGAMPNTQYELYWDEAAGDFKVTGQMVCGDNGCQTSDLPQVQAVAAAFWQSRGVQGWSQSLGGELFISLQAVSLPLDSDSVSVAYRTQDLVYPSQLPATLHCLRDCPTNATLTGYFAGPSADSPFVVSTANNWNPTTGAAVVSYHTNSTTALLMDAADQAVTFSDAEAFQQHPQYQYGVRTGRLFETLSDAECAPASGTYCDYKVNDLDVYYQWETGANSYSQFAAVKDASGEFVAFDAPLQVTFNVPNSAAYGQYAGQSLVLQYGGYGDLWGIPGHCVSRSTNEVVACDGEQSRYVPAFVIPFNATVGKVTTSNATYLVKWLDREIRFARKDAGVCAAAGLALPSGMTLPGIPDLKNPSDPNSDIYIGVKPAVTAAPRVIHGDVMF